MAIHQKCYGVVDIPEEDWLCHLCKSYNDINTINGMECILCPNKGGAMKPCTLRKSSHCYINMIKLRTSQKPKLFNSSSSNIEIKEEKNMSIIQNKIDNIESNNSLINFNSSSNIENAHKLKNDLNVNVSSNNNISCISNSDKNNINGIIDSNNNINNNNLGIQSQLSSNLNKDTESLCSISSTNKNNTKDDNSNKNLFTVEKNDAKNSKDISKKPQKAKTKNELYLSEKVARENAWVHLSCALWLPEISLASFDLKEKIKGIENISKKRLQEQCNICLKVGFGPTIKCQKCNYHFRLILFSNLILKDTAKQKQDH